RHNCTRGGLSATAALTGAADERFALNAIPYRAAQTSTLDAQLTHERHLLSGRGWFGFRYLPSFRWRAQDRAIDHAFAQSAAQPLSGTVRQALRHDGFERNSK